MSNTRDQSNLHLQKGRPALASEIVRRNRVVTMVTDREIQQLRELAESEGQSVSTYVREILIGHLKRGR